MIRQEMVLNQDNPRDMPRLFEPGWAPAPSQARRFWKYLHRWRVSLFHHCIREGCGDTQPADLARLVDHLLGTRLLLCYVGRRTRASTPDLQGLCAGSSQPTSAGLWEAIQAYFSCPILRSIFHPAWVPIDASIPVALFASGWEKRIANALWLLFRDHPPAFVLRRLSSALCRQPPGHGCVPPLRKRNSLHTGPDRRLPR